MIQTMPMPCCNAGPPLTAATLGACKIDDDGNVTFEGQRFGWDPKTGLCRACGKHISLYQCASPTCRVMVELADRFCDGCAGAFAMGIVNHVGGWHHDPEASGLRHRAFPGDGYHLCAYVDGRWFVERNGEIVSRGSVVGTDYPHLDDRTKIAAVGAWTTDVQMRDRKLVGLGPCSCGNFSVTLSKDGTPICQWCRDNREDRP